MSTTLLRVCGRNLRGVCEPLEKKSLFRLFNVRLYTNTNYRETSNSNHNRSPKKAYSVDDKSNGLLQTRLIKHIGISNVSDFNVNKAKIKYSEFFPISNVETLQENVSNVELADFSTLINFVYNYRISAATQNVISTTNLVDKECCKKLPFMECKDMFNTLYSFMFLMPMYITQLRFYESSMHKLHKELPNFSKRNLVQYCFYLGLSKQRRTDFPTYLKDAMDLICSKYMNELSVEDLCIVANAAFKMSVKMYNKDLVLKIANTIKKSVLKTELDVPFLVTFLKILRLSRFTDTDLLNEVSNVLLDSGGKILNFQSACHILAYYADSLQQHDGVLNILTKNCLNDLNNSEIAQKDLHDVESIRTKDITRFVWALGYLGYDLKEEMYEVIENIMLERYENGEFRNSTEDLFDTCLSLCMLNYTPEKLIPIVLSDRNMKIDFNRIRFEARKNLFITCLNIENPALLQELPHLESYVNRVMDQQFNAESYMSNRSGVQNVFNALSKTIDLKLDNLRLECQIPHLGITGITAEYGDDSDLLHIEVLDEGVCFKNKLNIPHGLMQLKLRLLKKMKAPVLTIQNDDIKGLNDLELMDYLKHKIEEFIETPRVDLRNKI